MNIKNKNFYLNNICNIFTKQYFTGWGRKRTGMFAKWSYKKFGGKLVLLEDGFIRSIGLGDDKSFSIVEDDIGIYYDATTDSRLEKILKEYDLTKYIKTAKKSINLIKTKKISKYNNGKLKLPQYLQTSTKKVLIIAQTKGDLSLKYGYANLFDDKYIIQKALKDNPDSEIYLKVHPDVIAGKKESNINIEYAKKYCKIIDENFHPIVLLEAFNKVYTQTSQMGFEAALLGKEVHILGAPFYVGWGIENLHWHLDENIKKEILKRRGKKLTIEELFTGAFIIYSKYFNPFKNKKSNIIDTIETIDKYRKIYIENSGNLYFFGFKPWKRKYIKPFFYTIYKNKIFFCNDLKDGLKKGLNNNSKIFIWGKKEFKNVEEFAKKNKIKIYRVEDGFLRSVSLGSDLTRPYSLVIDSKGIYFDPSKESDLEYILNNYKFDEKIIKRAKKLKDYLINNKISKYNIFSYKKLNIKTNKKIIFVPGQVEDDASIIYGANGMSNLELLQKVRKNNRDAFIIFKPHPDVVVGNRIGNIDKDIALKYCDLIIDKISIDSILEICDEVHTMTSLVGFEALIRGKKVYTYGIPFYSNWGLTIDEKKLQRRKRKLTIEELIAGAYIIYPRYIHPKTFKFCEVEVLISELEKIKKLYNSNLIYRYFTNIRNYLSRKSQLILRLINEKL
ncbi:capsular polysaccharide biosynthesis protein [Caminibacter mediatlanticus TB-2]|uniref:Capsular polysaccharide biosynthesis protein n=1 Tax=Caminibacter mediatlanticus TB-2 TaxID=391592 RepID=A0ABX5V8V1_9BACT|nr:capsular polysaccharide biosynthesis protein [Caminibacter mediatlanticus]QCT94715.1 capsular polysaccharide biosynthesis protein [Caminibacter mediatlanticus TB-2]